MKEKEDNDPLSGPIEVDDAYLGGKNKGGKRGRGAENKLPFFAAIQNSDDQQPIKMKLRIIEGFTKVEAVKWQQTFLKGPCTLVFEYRFNRRFDLSVIFKKLLKDSAFTPAAFRRPSAFALLFDLLSFDWISDERFHL